MVGNLSPDLKTKRILSTESQSMDQYILSGIMKFVWNQYDGWLNLSATVGY